MPLFALIKRRIPFVRLSILFLFLLCFSLLTIAQVNLKFRLLTAYTLTDEATVLKNKPTLFVFEQSETFEQSFQPATPSKQRPDHPNWSKEMVVGVALPATNTPPRLSVSRVFVQDSTLTVRYIRMADTTQSRTIRPVATSPTLLITIPRQTVLRTRLVENGKVVQTLKRREVEP